MSTRYCLVLSAVAATWLAPLTFAHICWVEKISTERDGVRVFFVAGAYNITGGTKSQGRFVIGHNEILWLNGPKVRQTEPGLVLQKDESVTLIQGVEDTCVIAFAEVDGHVGITVHANLSLPYLPHDDTKEFIASQ